MEIKDSGEYRFLIQWKGYCSKELAERYANSLIGRYRYENQNEETVFDYITVKPTEDVSKSEIIINDENYKDNNPKEADKLFDFLKQQNRIKQVECFNYGKASKWIEGLEFHYANLQSDEYVVIYQREKNQNEVKILSQITSSNEFLYLGQEEEVTNINNLHDCIMDETQKEYQAFAELTIANCTNKFRLHGSYSENGAYITIDKTIIIDKPWKL